MPDRQHPFLICKKSEYEALRRRAERSPWREFRKQALRVFDTAKIDPEAHVGTRGYQLRDLLGACACVYVVEPERRAEALEKGMDALRAWHKYLPDIDAFWHNHPKRWYATTPSSSAFFQSVVFLDVAHDDLAPDDLAEVEKLLDDAAEWFWAEYRGWEMATTGPRMLWAIYQADEERLPQALEDYRAHVMDNLTESGVFYAGPEYATGRLGGERTAKYGPMHVAEYTGIYPRYYDNPTLEGFYEWLYAAAYAPNGSCVTFGDSGHGRGFTSLRPATMAWAAGNFSDKAAAYAAHRIAIERPPSPTDLLSYCIVRNPPPEPVAPPSRVWPDGMAMFRERNETTAALMGALWNVTAQKGHSHYDANAVYLAGYGDILLLNSGYKGYGTGLGEFSWDYVHRQAISGNALLVDGRNHTTAAGEGIVEHMLTRPVDSATGLVDRALEGPARHLRTFCFVHPADGAPGYFVLFDEVDRAQGASEVNLSLHPASDKVRAIEPGAAYRWDIAAQQGAVTQLTVFLGGATAREPELRDGLLAGWKDSFIGKYLYASHAVQAPGAARLCTLLFPHNDAHPCAEMTRLDETNAQGARIAHPSGPVDIAMTPKAGVERVEAEGLALRGASILCRCIGEDVAFYVAHRALEVKIGPWGFESNAPVSLSVDARHATVVCAQATELNLRAPGIANVEATQGSPARLLGREDGSVRVALDAGSHRLALRTAQE